MTTMLSTLEIAQAAALRPIGEVADELGLLHEEVEPYGRYKAKVDLSVIERLADRPDAKLINVTAVTPTPAGEGKTTTAISLAVFWSGPDSTVWGDCTVLSFCIVASASSSSGSTVGLPGRAVLARSG